MPRRLLLEGADLETLLLRVRAEMGPTARVVKAERVRSGGVAGFFAKERYELTVDVPDTGSAGPVRPGPAGAVRPGAPGSPQAPLSLPVQIVTPAAGAGAAGSGPAAPMGIEALLDAADAGDGAVAEDEVPVSTERDSFASVLDSVRQLAAQTRSEGGAAGPAAPEVLVEEATTPAQPVVAPVVEPPAVAPPVVLGKTVRPAEFVSVRTTGATLPELVDLGVPRRLLADLPPGQGRYTLSEVMSRVPRAPQVVREPASVVVVAGQGESVVEAAQVVARRLGVPDTSIALAGRLSPQTGFGPWVLTGMSARRLRAATVESEEPLVVALGVGADASDWSLASGLVGAFDPDQVWAAVEADRSVQDVRRWMRAVGQVRSFDAVAACRVATTSAPARVLELDVPVGLIDGVPASAPVWAATLSEHLADPVWD
ncbi:hypothetical protein [Sanguibacter suaedae]|uniref:Uncharacterized protein n=1 Tax=Sanguibacter suaedae TaxID=2795737 RepID=A0A934IB10_9MICO|nr:hypothetical protein [Sanguibacter suaedae]MBI9114591.1 hypothetical protein [Sanguibacter suaedae]